MNILPNLFNTYSLNFNGKYSAEEICTKLCGGACCNHSTPMNAKLKNIAEKLFAQTSQATQETTKTPAKLNLYNWLCIDSNPKINLINNKSKIYLNQLFREHDPAKRAKIIQELEKINKELEELCTDSECFVPITNPRLANNPSEAYFPEEDNVCIFKDHGNTNKCTIYNGVKELDGTITPRPHACQALGSDELPCPWLSPERYLETVYKLMSTLASQGYKASIEDYQRHVAQQFNLNDTFVKEIWKPFIESKKKKG